MLFPGCHQRDSSIHSIGSNQSHGRGIPQQGQNGFGLPQGLQGRGGLAGPTRHSPSAPPSTGHFERAMGGHLEGGLVGGSSRQPANLLERQQQLRGAFAPKANGPTSESVGASAAAMMAFGNIPCPQCQVVPSFNSSARLVRETCGHFKCRQCLLLEESGCVQCRRQMLGSSNPQASSATALPQRGTNPGPGPGGRLSQHQLPFQQRHQYPYLHGQQMEQQRQTPNLPHLSRLQQLQEQNQALMHQSQQQQLQLQHQQQQQHMSLPRGQMSQLNQQQMQQHSLFRHHQQMMQQRQQQQQQQQFNSLFPEVKLECDDNVSSNSPMPGFSNHMGQANQSTTSQPDPSHNQLLQTDRQQQQQGAVPQSLGFNKELESLLNSHDFDKIKHKGLSDLIEGKKEPEANSSGSPSQSAPKNISRQESLSEFPAASGDDISERPGTPPAKGQAEGDDDEADSATSNLTPRTLKDLADFREKLLTVDKWVKDTDFYEACEDEQTQRMGKQYMGRLHDFLLNVEVNEEVIANGKRVGDTQRKALVEKLKEEGRLNELDESNNDEEEVSNRVSREDNEPKYPLVKRFQTNKEGGVTCVDVPTDDLLKKRNGNLFQGTEPSRQDESNGAPALPPLLSLIKEEEIKKESASPQPPAGHYLDTPSLPPPTPGGPGGKKGKRKRNSIDHENYAHIIKKMHLNPPEYQCTICNRQFKNRLNIRYHIACADKSAGHACKECTRIFKSSSHLTYHMRTAHGGEKPYKCSFCEKAFAQSVKLKRHERTHTGERPFKCDVCQHTFTTKYNLKEHENIHKSEKPYSCQTCSMRFADRNNLRRHEMTHASAAADFAPTTPMAFHERLGLPSPRKMPKVETFQEKIDKVSQDWRILMEKRKRDRLFSDHQPGSLSDSFRKSMFPTSSEEAPNPALPLFDSSNTEAVNLFQSMMKSFDSFGSTSAPSFQTRNPSPNPPHSREDFPRGGEFPRTQERRPETAFKTQDSPVFAQPNTPQPLSTLPDESKYLNNNNNNHHFSGGPVTGSYLNGQRQSSLLGSEGHSIDLSNSSAASSANNAGGHGGQDAVNRDHEEDKSNTLNLRSTACNQVKDLLRQVQGEEIYRVVDTLTSKERRALIEILKADAQIKKGKPVPVTTSMLQISRAHNMDAFSDISTGSKKDFLKRYRKQVLGECGSSSASSTSFIFPTAANSISALERQALMHDMAMRDTEAQEVAEAEAAAGATKRFSDFQYPSATLGGDTKPTESNSSFDSIMRGIHEVIAKQAEGHHGPDVLARTQAVESNNAEDRKELEKESAASAPERTPESQHSPNGSPQADPGMVNNEAGTLVKRNVVFDDYDEDEDE